MIPDIISIHRYICEHKGFMYVSFCSPTDFNLGRAQISVQYWTFLSDKESLKDSRHVVPIGT